MIDALLNNICRSVYSSYSSPSPDFSWLSLLMKGITQYPIVIRNLFMRIWALIFTQVNILVLYTYHKFSFRVGGRVVCLSETFGSLVCWHWFYSEKQVLGFWGWSLFHRFHFFYLSPFIREMAWQNWSIDQLKQTKLRRNNTSCRFTKNYLKAYFRIGPDIKRGILLVNHLED